MQRRQLNIEDMQAVAKSYGGKCLSKEYIKSKLPLQWMCKRGHTWDRSYDVIYRNGIWCSQCQKDESVLEDLRELAEERGFKCLSTSYINSYTNLKWQCAEGHVFQMLPKNFKKWGCGICNKKKYREDALKKIIAQVKKKGGEYVSGTYQGTFSKIQIRCGNNHPWAVSRHILGHGKWCPTCKREEICQKELKKLDNLAKKRGGKCLSQKFERIDRNLKWQCGNGHTFLATPRNFKTGAWCAKCSRENAKIRTRDKRLTQLKSYVKSKGGKVITKEYKTYWQKLKIECAKGHTWSVHAHEILIRKSWCAQCHRDAVKMKVFGKLRSIAEKRGGQLLSKTYKNNKTRIKVKCANGHVWQTAANIIKIGSWCPTCWHQRSVL